MAEDRVSGQNLGLSEENIEAFLDDNYAYREHELGLAEEQAKDDFAADNPSKRHEYFLYEQYNWSNFKPKNYRVIRLTKGYFAVVSPSDYNRVSKFKWCANVQVDKMTGEVVKVYAYRRRSIQEQKRGAPNLIYLHRFVKGVVYSGHKQVVDHRNGYSLDCRNGNLTTTDQSGNIANIGFRTKTVNRDLPRGVKPVKRRLPDGTHKTTSYKGRITVRGKEMYSKAVFSCPERAHRWYVRMHDKLHPHADSWNDQGNITPILFPPTVLQARVDAGEIPF